MAEDTVSVIIRQTMNLDIQSILVKLQNIITFVSYYNFNKTFENWQ